MDKISIIIPVYNVEDYVRKCLDSVINQTYRNLEILIIDDGSTDDSGKICDEYAKKDARIKVFHKDNGGNTAIPRNVGLNHMTGKYVGFVDSDDWIELDMFETLYNARNGVDVVVSSYFRDTVSGSEAIENMKKIRERVISTKNMLVYPLKRDYYMGFCGYLWNKLFKAELFDNLRFDESIKWASDVLTYTELVKRGNVKGTYIDKPLYHYIVSREGAVTTSESYTVKTDILRVYKSVEKLIPDKDKYWARGFYCYHASSIAEFARKKRDAKMLGLMQSEMRERYADYKRTNWRFPNKYNRIKALMNCKMVNFCEYDIDRFPEQVGDKSIVCFGAGLMYDSWCIRNYDMARKIKVIIDNNKTLQGTYSKIGETKIPIVSFDKFLNMHLSNYILLVNTNRFPDFIIEQLDLSGELGGVDVYVPKLKDYKNDHVLKKLQMFELKILDEFVRICDKHNLKYYLYAGTLLGAVRHKGFIPWDDDIDVCMPHCDFEKFTQLPPQEFSNGYYLRWISNDKNYEGTCARIFEKNTSLVTYSDEYVSANADDCRIFIDIFPPLYLKKQYSFFYKYMWRCIVGLERITRSKSGRSTIMPKKIYSLFSINFLMELREWIAQLFYDPNGFWRRKPAEEVFGDGVLVEFEGKLYNAPKDWDYYLTAHFGEGYMKLPPPEKRFSHSPRKLSFDVKSGVWEDV